MQDIKEFLVYCIHRHDIECNQKYDKTLPYSFHLKCVMEETKQWSYLLKDDEIDIAICAAMGHDLIEDARVTYNDVLAITNIAIADIIYACTEEKGKNREERHCERYYAGLGENPIAAYVKMCDIISNVKYSMLTNSSMLDRYRKEVHKMFPIVPLRFDAMVVYLRKLVEL